jgi:hypothetical protein
MAYLCHSIPAREALNEAKLVEAGLRHSGTAFKMRFGIIKSIRRLKSPFSPES